MKSKTEYQLNPEMEEAARAVKTQKKHYYDYSSEQKLLFVYYNDRVKLFNAAKSGRLAGGIAERTAQKWAKRLKEDKDWSILEKKTNNKVKRPKAQLDERHKIHLLNFYDDNPQARIVDVVASLISAPCI